MQTAFYDYTSTNTCTGSPILVSYVRDTCIGRQFEITNNSTGGGTMTCQSALTDYSWEQTSCNPNSNNIDISNWSRNYVVKELFTYSSTCEDNVAQAFAVAADDICHPMTMEMASTQHTQAYVKVNCNANSPIWNTCWDNKCLNCTVETFGGSPCKLMGAAASNKIRCISAPNVPASPTRPTSTTNTVSIPTGSWSVNQENEAITCHVSLTVISIVFIILLM